MKKLFIGLLVLGSMNLYAKTCHVSEASNGTDDFDVHLATYENIENSQSPIITIIKKNGKVLTNVDFEKYFKGATTQEEIERRSNELENSRMAIISVDHDEESLNLSTGLIKKVGEKTIAAAIALGGLDTSKSAVFDMKNRLSILCLK